MKWNVYQSFVDQCVTPAVRLMMGPCADRIHCIAIPAMLFRSVEFIGSDEMNNETEEEAFDRMAKELEAEKATKNRQGSIILAMFATSGISVLIAFVFFGRNPAVSCAFLDNETLRWFWPPNATIMNALKNSRYSHADQCLFIATRSFASMTMLPAVIIFIWQLFKSERSHVQGYGTVLIILLLASFLTGFIGPSDSNSRFGMNFTLGIGQNIWVSMIHIFSCYLAALMLAFQIPASFRSIFR